MLWFVYVAVAVQAISLTNGFPNNHRECEVDVAFVVVSSGNRGYDAFEYQKNFIENIARRFSFGSEYARFSAAFFSDHVVMETFFKDNFDQNTFVDSIHKMCYKEGGPARMYRAIEHMRTHLFDRNDGSRDNADRVAIIISDWNTDYEEFNGHLNTQYHWERTRKQVQLAREAGIRFITVGIGSDVDEEHFRIFADNSNNYRFSVGSYDELSSLEETISERACNSFSGVAEKRSYNDFNAEGERPREVCQGRRADVFFLVDESSSIYSHENFQQEMSFVQQVIDYFDVAEDLTHVGVITFGDTARMRFNLNEYYNKENLNSAIQNMDWRHGGETGTNYEAAFRMLRDQGFRGEHGARGVARFGIVVTNRNSVSQSQSWYEEAKRLRDEGVHMFVMGFGSSDNGDFNQMASNQEFVFTVNSIDQLNDMTDNVAYRICQESGSGNFEGFDKKKLKTMGALLNVLKKAGSFM